MITKDEFLEKYNISRDLFANSGMTWEDFCEIHDDFASKFPIYDSIRDDFVKTYLKNMNSKDRQGEMVNVHAVRSRVKNPEHLVAKIIRKKQENDTVYRPLNKGNYEKIVRDLIGIRCLLVFKRDWIAFHHYIMSKFENDEANYIKDALRDFDEDETHYYFAEEPKVHLRNGDHREIYEEEKLLAPDHIIGGKTYRAVHYIIKYKGVYLEIQVRTLFEEGWSEVDHAIAYPYHKNDPVLKEYTELLNRLSGLGDEMGTFFDRLRALVEMYLRLCPVEEEQREESGEKRDTEEKENFSAEKKDMSTAEGCLQSVLDE